MCLIVFAHQLNPDWPLIMAANRDEFLQRPTKNMHWWPDIEILAGKDLDAGGTWLGIHKDGRWAGVTNFRKATDKSTSIEAFKTRGQLVINFLRQNDTSLAYANSLQMDQFAGFNLLLWDNHELVFCANNEQQPPKVLPPGLYGLSNGVLDCNWPKVKHVKHSLMCALHQPPLHQNLQQIMLDTAIAQDNLLPNTGIAIDWERRLSSCFIDAPDYDYGTRSCISVLRDRMGNMDVFETCFDHLKPLTQHFTWMSEEP